MLGDHFFIDTVKIFVPSEDLAFKVVSIHFRFDQRFDGFNILFTFFLVAIDQLFDLSVFLGLEVHKRSIFKLFFYPVNTEPACNGRIYVQRFPGDHFPFFR